MPYRTDLGPRTLCKASFSSLQEAESWANKTIVDIHAIAGEPISGAINFNLDMEAGDLIACSIDPDTHMKQVRVRISRDNTGRWTFASLNVCILER